VLLYSIAISKQYTKPYDVSVVEDGRLENDWVLLPQCNPDGTVLMLKERSMDASYGVFAWDYSPMQTHSLHIHCRFCVCGLTRSARFST
jgi:hypothetical protein